MIKLISAVGVGFFVASSQQLSLQDEKIAKIVPPSIGGVSSQLSYCPSYSQLYNPYIDQCSSISELDHCKACINYGCYRCTGLIDHTA